MNWRPIRGWTRLLHEREMKADSMPERLLIGPGSPPSLDPVYPELSPPLEPCPGRIGRGSATDQMVNLCGELFGASLPRPKHGVVAPNLGDDSGRHEDHGTTEI